jgi:hypothetical protein
MKKNLILTGILAVLLVGTYFFQEKRNETHYNESLVKDHLIMKGIVELKLPSVSAIKKEDSWWEGTRLLSHNAFKVIEQKITEVKKIKDVVGEWKTFFTDPLTLFVNGEEWVIGDLSLDRQGFYLSRDKKIMLVTLEGSSSELTQDENSVAVKKYDEFKREITKTHDDLIEKQIFRFYPDLSAKRVLIESYERLPYELNFDKNETLPAPIPGIKVHDKIQAKFKSLLTLMTMKQEIPYSENLKVKRLGTIKFIAAKTVTWELWLKSEKAADSVLIDPETKRAFLMIGGTLKIYFTMVQDYWDKKVIPPSEFKPSPKIDMLLAQGKKSIHVDILNQEPLKFESTQSRLNQENLLSMINVIFNLSQFDQADRVSILSSSEKKMLMTQDDLRVSVLGQSLILWVRAEELIVVNLTQGFKAHFMMYRQKIGMTLADMVK